MILVDSSVWIEYLSPRTSPISPKLEALIRPANYVLMTGVIFQEVLQGIRSERSYRLTERLLERLPFLVPTPKTHSQAAEIFRKLVSKGKSLTTIDVLIAALAIENRVSLFTLDEDFQALQFSFNLRLFEIS